MGAGIRGMMTTRDSHQSTDTNADIIIIIVVIITSGLMRGVHHHQRRLSGILS